jgi:PTS system ascorbate-specific IIA component
MSLDEILDSEMIRVGVRVADWQAAIAAAGELLVRVGAVEERYVNAMIRVATELGPYIVVAPGVAMPHARPDDGVIRTALSLVVLANPVEFGNEENDPVDIVIGLAADDHDEHIELMGQLATMLDTVTVVEAFRSAATAESIRVTILEQLEEIGERG